MYLSGRYTRWQSTIHWRNMSLKNRSTYLVDSCRYMTWLNRSWRVKELLVYKSLLAEKMLQSLLSWKYENIGMLTAIPAVYPLTTLHWPKPYFRSKISTRVFSLVSSGENDGLSSGLCTGSVWDKRIIIAIPETFTWWKGVTSSAVNRLIGEVVQSRRRPLLGPSPGWKRLLPLSHLRHY